MISNRSVIEQYLPESLNKVFDKTCYKILGIYDLIKNNDKFDTTMINEQLHITLEKFARKLIITITEASSKFAVFKRIRRSVDITKSLFFIVF